MTNDFIIEKLKAEFGEEIFKYEELYDILTFHADKELNLKILTFLKETPELNFSYLNDLTAIHYPDNVGKELVVTYLLQNMMAGKRIRLKVSADIKKPNVYTASALFATANWLEREAYDFFGVNFVGHPNLIRIMNVDEMDYFPLRKEFPLEDQTRIDKDDEMFGR